MVLVECNEIDYSPSLRLLREPDTESRAVDASRERNEEELENSRQSLKDSDREDVVSNSFYDVAVVVDDLVRILSIR